MEQCVFISQTQFDFKKPDSSEYIVYDSSAKLDKTNLLC